MITDHHRTKALTHTHTVGAQAALFAVVSAAEVLSSSIEGAEGAEGPGDQAAATNIAHTLLQLLLHLSSLSPSLGQSSGRIQLVELQLMRTLAPALMHHLATSGGQAQVSYGCCCACRFCMLVRMWAACMQLLSI